jgi:hypothetical protein
VNKKNFIANAKEHYLAHKTEIIMIGSFLTGAAVVVVTYAVRDYYRVPFLVKRNHLPNILAGKGMAVFEYDGTEVVLVKNLSKN